VLLHTTQTTPQILWYTTTSTATTTTTTTTREEATLTCEDVTGVCHHDVLTDEQCYTLITDNVPTNDTSNLQIASVLILLTDVKEEKCYSERERKIMQIVIDTMKQKVQQDKQEKQQQKRQIRVSFYSQKAGMPNGCC